MKLIIDIDDKTYDKIKRIDKIHGIAPLNEYEIAIANGTPLEDIRTDIHRHKMDFYPSDYTLINTLIDKWINRGVDV